MPVCFVLCVEEDGEGNDELRQPPAISVFTSREKLANVVVDLLVKHGFRRTIDEEKKDQIQKYADMIICAGGCHMSDPKDVSAIRLRITETELDPDRMIPAPKSWDLPDAANHIDLGLY